MNATKDKHIKSCNPKCGKHLLRASQKTVGLLGAVAARGTAQGTRVHKAPPISYFGHLVKHCLFLQMHAALIYATFV